MAHWRTVLGATVSEPSALPEHGVTVAFVHLANTKVELLEPLGERSPVAKFLARNPEGGIHHLCLDVVDIHSSLAHVTAHVRALDKTPKIGSHGTPVAFLHPKDTLGCLLELQQVDKRGT